MRDPRVLLAPEDHFWVADAMVVPIAKDKEYPPMPEILHVTPRDEWERAVAEGEYRGDTLGAAGAGQRADVPPQPE